MSTTLVEVRNKLLHETPVQWCVHLSQASRRLDEGGFDSLRQFIEAPVQKGGLGITLEKAKEFLYFNSAYKHKADSLAEEIGLPYSKKMEQETETVHSMTADGATNSEIAQEIGRSERTITRRRVDKNEPEVENCPHKIDKNARNFGWMPISPADAATKIREKFGDEYADQLKSSL